jgi:phosphomannomutase
MWVMIRASGTEPVIRIYAEAQNPEEVSSIINATINSINHI